MKRSWRVREGLYTIVLDVDPGGAGAGARPDEDDRSRSAFLIGQLVQAVTWRPDGASGRALREVGSALYGAGAAGAPPSSSDDPQARMPRLEQALRRAIAAGRLRVREWRPPAAAVVEAEADEPVLGWEKEGEADGKLWVLSVHLRTPGGEPLAFERLEVFRHGTDEPIGITLETDKDGRAATLVPSDGTYDLRLLTDWEDDFEQIDDADVATHLHCQFFTEDEEPIVGETVDVTGPSGSFELVTGAEGEIDTPAEPGDYELTILGEKFKAHTLYAAEHDAADLYYQFVVPGDYDWEQHDPLREHRWTDDEDDEGA
jgi:hypothetical protein